MVNKLKEEERCPKCNRLLFKKFYQDGVAIKEKDNYEIEIKCPKCSNIIVVK